jgi:hypothetical protein
MSQDTVNNGRATGNAWLTHDDALAMLAGFGERAPESVDDVVGSLELTWLIAEVEQRRSVVLDLTDEQLARIHTVADAADALDSLLGAMEPR